MPKRVTVVVTSDRYGGASAEFDIEREVIALYPDLDVDLRGAEPKTAADMIALGQDADALLLSTREAVTREVVSAIPRVKVVGRYGVGLDNVDLEAAAEFGLVVTHFPQYCTAEVADHTLSLILAMNRRIVEQDQDVHTGAWAKHGAATNSILRGPVQAMRDLTIGIIAFGAIGRAVGRRLTPFGANILAFDPFVPSHIFQQYGVESTSLNELLARSDLVTVHSPLLPETRGLIDAQALARMKPDAVLVNTARGPIVNEAALISHLQRTPTFRAALDVVEHEPLSLKSPLYSLRNVLLTPHSAYYSERSVDTVQRETLAGALDVLSGIKPLTVANPSVLARIELSENPRANFEF